jgi:phosphoribosylformylglycinamidine synthase
MYRAIITVTLRPSILDPEGKAISHALLALGLAEVEDVRVGKHIELRVRAASEDAAAAAVKDACARLLANPVMEDYSFRIERLAE